MNLTSKTTSTSQSEIERIKSEIQRILQMQAEIEVLQQQEDEAAEKAAKQEFPFGEVADLTSIMELNRISTVLEPKYEQLREAVSALHGDVIPTNIFIGQHYYDTWIRVEPGLLIRFPFDNDRFGFEVKEESC